MKRKLKKLELHSETLLSLNPETLRVLKGGLTEQLSTCIVCMEGPTSETCGTYVNCCYY